jgi:DNA primase
MIDRQTVDRIFEAAHIVDVVGDFITLRKRGADYVGLCPFHADTNPSFRVSPSRNICTCFVCGESFTAAKFIMRHENVSYVEALRWLARKYGISVKERELSEDERRLAGDRESMLIVNSWAQRFFTSRLYEHEEGQTIAMPYFVERGFREDVIRKFQLGYGLKKRDDLYRTALSQGYKEEYLLKTGLCTRYDDGRVMDHFHGRVIFPIHTVSGKIVAFGGRVLHKDYSPAKYKNSPDSELYNKSYEIYGLYFAKQAIQKADKCYLVEGYTDVISMHQSGIENVVAACGTSLTVGHIRLIHRFTNNITLLNDGDTAGIKASLKDVDKIFEEGMNVKIALLPDGEDPDSFARKHNSFELNLYLKEHELDFITFKTKLLLKEAGNDPFARATLVNEIMETVSKIKDSIVRTVYITECSQMLNVREEELIARVARLIEVNARLPRVSEPPRYTKSTVSPTPLPAVTIGTSGTIDIQSESVSKSATAPEEAGAVEEASETSAPPSAKPVRPKHNPLNRFEALLLRYVIRYGERTLYTEPTPVRVAEYIKNELSIDDLTFQTPVYREILEQAVEQCGRDGFIAERYFLTHPDMDISKLATDMLSSRYSLSRRFSAPKSSTEQEEELSESEKRRRAELRCLKEREQLVKWIVHDVCALKNAYLQLEIKELDAQVRMSGDDFERCIELLRKRQQLEKAVLYFSKQLGERVITGV